jgi:hypothetical protein
MSAITPNAAARRNEGEAEGRDIGGILGCGLAPERCAAARHVGELVGKAPLSVQRGLLRHL